MTREEAERALDECHRELQALLKRYGAELCPETEVCGQCTGRVELYIVDPEKPWMAIADGVFV